MAKQNHHLVRTLADVAEFFGVNRGTPGAHWRPGMPESCGVRGAWDLLAISQWLVTSYYCRPASETDSMQRAKLAQKVEQSKLARLKRERLAAGLIARADHERTAQLLRRMYDSAIAEAETLAVESAPRGRRTKVAAQLAAMRQRLAERVEAIT